MNKRINYIIVSLIAIVSIGICAKAFVPENLISAITSAPPAQTKPATTEQKEAIKLDQNDTTVPRQNIRYTDPLVIVGNPSLFLNKHINVAARFNKFSTLGLDYKPAMRSSETYISFLILRSDTDKHIPLPEMKLFLKRTAAEKLVDLKEGDKVEFSGNVFSNALGDVWVDVDNLAKLK